jgi:4,5-DOPA dioxygenase extradiol
MSKPFRMPVAFFGHGSPMNTLESNRHTEAWRVLGATLPKPRAILMVSAHWYTEGAAVTAMDKPATIHDFFGFPQALFDVRYPAPGDPALAARVRDLLAPIDIGMDQQWGLDHGTWSVLAHVYPQADIPVVQLAIDARQPAAWHYDLGRRLAPLRDEGVSIVGSGDVVHNLRVMRRGADAPPYDWAERFNQQVRAYIEAGEHAPLIAYESLGEDARASIPTPEHYLPLLYVLGAQAPGDKVSFVTDGIELGSISMLTCVIGPQ